MQAQVRRREEKPPGQVEVSAVQAASHKGGEKPEVQQAIVGAQLAGSVALVSAGSPSPDGAGFQEARAPKAADHQTGGAAASDHGQPDVPAPSVRHHPRLPHASEWAWIVPTRPLSAQHSPAHPPPHRTIRLPCSADERMAQENEAAPGCGRCALQGENRSDGRYYGHLRQSPEQLFPAAEGWTAAKGVAWTVVAVA